jgi:hypothetical protein
MSRVREQKHQFAQQPPSSSYCQQQTNCGKEKRCTSHHKGRRYGLVNITRDGADIRHVDEIA